MIALLPLACTILLRLTNDESQNDSNVRQEKESSCLERDYTSAMKRQH